MTQRKGTTRTEPLLFTANRILTQELFRWYEEGRLSLRRNETPFKAVNRVRKVIWNNKQKRDTYVKMARERVKRSKYLQYASRR